MLILTFLCLLLLPAAKGQNYGQAVGRVPRYTVTDIGFLPGFTDMYPAAINIHGDVVGSAPVGGGGPGFPFGEVFLYSNGQLIIAGAYNPAFPDLENEATGINARKEVLFLVEDVGDYYSWIYQQNVESYEFGVPGGNPAVGTGINDSGQIIGWANDIEYFNFLFTPNAPLIQLPFFPTAINNLGQVAGNAGSDVVITQPGGMKPSDLGNLGGPAHATGINILGQVVGYSATTNQSNSPVFGVLYSQGAVINLGLPKGETARDYQSFATGINDQGVIVGYSDVAGEVFGTEPSSDARGLVYVKGRWYDLNDLVNATGKGFTITKATGINNVGQIIATALDPAGTQHAIILTVVGSKAKP